MIENINAKINMSINEKKLDFYIKNNLNVLIRGRRGTGKSSMIIDAFKKNNLKYKYFSAATMDPWVDFVGVPKEKIDENGRSYLELIRPKEFMDDEVEAIFFDEFNRSKSKIANAVMELIQFKSINGKKFNNLRMIWAAINPDDTDEEYAVEKLDPAHLDRFHVIINSDDKPDRSYFKTTYGEKGIIAIDWWNALDKPIQNKISPRRLDYTLSMFNCGGDIRDVLPEGVNIQQLLIQLNSGSYISKLLKILEEQDASAAKTFLDDENSFVSTIDHIIKNDNCLNYFHEFLSPEKFSGLIIGNNKFRELMLTNDNYIQTHKDELENILKAKNIHKKILTVIKSKLKGKIDTPDNSIIARYYSKTTDKMSTTQIRYKALRDIAACIPFDTLTVNDIDYVKEIFCVTACAYGRSSNLANAQEFGKILPKIMFYLTSNKIPIGNFFTSCQSLPMYKKWIKASTFVAVKTAMSKFWHI